MALAPVTRTIGTTFTISGITTAIRSLARVATAWVGHARSMAAAARRYFAPILAGLRSIGAFSFNALQKAASLAFKGIAAGATLAALKIKAIATAALLSSKEIASLMNQVSKDSRRLGMTAEDTAMLRTAFELEGIDADEVLPTISEITREFGLVKQTIAKQDLELSRQHANAVIDLYRMSAAKDYDGMRELSMNFSSKKMESFTYINDKIAELEQNLSGVNDRYTARGRVMPGPGYASTLQWLDQLRRARDEMVDSFGSHGKALFALQKFGLDVDKAMQPGIEGLYEVSDAFQRMTNPAEKLDIAMQLFGEDAGAKMVTILEKGRSGMEEYRREMERLGGTITETDAKLGADYDQNTQKMMLALRGVRLELARQILPLLMESQTQLTEWLVANRVWIAETMKVAFIQVRAFMLDVIDIWRGKRGDFRTGWLNSVGSYLLYLVDLAAEVKDQVVRIFNGGDSDWEWLNAIRDGFVAIKTFALDAYEVLTGGQAETYKWLNDAKRKFDEFVDGAKVFMGKLSEAWTIFSGILQKIHAAFEWVWSSFSNVDPTVAIMVLAFAKVSGVLTGIALLGRVVIGIFGGIGRAAVAASGAATAAGAATVAARGAMMGMLVNPVTGALAAGLGIGTYIGTKMNEATDRREWTKANAAGDLVRIQGDASYFGRRNFLLDQKNQSVEAQDFRILHQRQNGMDDPYRRTSKEIAEDGEMVFNPVTRQFIPAKHNSYLLAPREDGSTMGSPSKTIEVNFNLDGKKTTGTFPSNAEGFFTGMNNAVNLMNRR